MCRKILYGLEYFPRFRGGVDNSVVVPILVQLRTIAPSVPCQAIINESTRVVVPLLVILKIKREIVELRFVVADIYPVSRVS